MFQSRLRQLLLEESAKRGDRIEQKEVAEKTGLQEVTISKWMSDKPMAQIRAETVDALMNFFNCEFGDLVVFIPSKDDEDPESKTRSAQAA